MKSKRIIAAALSGTVILSASGALAKDNIYAYNKFVSTIIGPQLGYCDTAASFAGHENEYSDVKEYFSGLISAHYADIDMDFDNELITVESSAVSVYGAQEKGVAYLGGIDEELIANYGDSYANVFTVPVGNKQYVGVETYSSVGTTYRLELYKLDPDTDELSAKLKIEKTINEDEHIEDVWADGKTYYSFVNANGLQSLMNSDGYENSIAAARAALKSLSITDWFVESDDRMCFPDEKVNTAAVTKEEAKLMSELKEKDDHRLAHFISDVTPITYIRSTGLRFNEKPIVLFEDYSSISELKVKPDIVTVEIDGKVLQFPTQDPMIIEGRTLVPVRTIMEEFGAQVDWIDADGVQKIVIKTDDKNIELAINSREFVVNGEKQDDLDVPAQLINDKTLVPFRAITETLGCTVDWNGDTKTVIITSQE